MSANLRPPSRKEDGDYEALERSAEDHGDRAGLVNAIHGWCPQCGGHGMVMGFGGPDDCPNLDAHRLLAALAWEPMKRKDGL